MLRAGFSIRKRRRGETGGVEGRRGWSGGGDGVAEGMEWRRGWSGGVVEWWSGGVVEWWSSGVVEYSRMPSVFGARFFPSEGAVCPFHQAQFSWEKDFRTRVFARATSLHRRPAPASFCRPRLGKLCKCLYRDRSRARDRDRFLTVAMGYRRGLWRCRMVV
jgi:hypothetical protein